ncbi:hypothetical protein BaRGS_00008171 [Batillaria attramentaria]|uniref:Fe2OG dioxygenase domain-containing protein n=1 Tax=Batillaria attramentaria TaxID=370345 RepID=A0ABD0LMV7_9CAEN
MAARMDGHTSKQQRKLTKKIARIKDHLSKTENITVCDYPTEVVCVQNGGLDNGISQADIYHIFQHEMPPGLKLVPDFISAETEGMLLQAVSFEEESSCGSSLKHRQVKHFGYEFKYGINNVNPNAPLDEGIPEVCGEFLHKALEQNLVAHYPDQLTVNRYLPGQGIPPHVDTPSAFEDGLMSLSCGSQVLMDFRHPDGRHLSVLLPPRSLLVMTGESRYIWSHGITPRKSDIVPSEQGGLTLAPRGVRVSFTFRKLSSTAGITPEIGKDSVSCMPTSDREAATLESQHVHTVYEEIAGHFSDTRHKPWPKIAEFLLAQEHGSILVDIGCGNGKYFGINTHLCEIGSDRSENLASICHSRGHKVFVSDVLAIPVRSCTVDVGLCIAVIHHLSTQTRRRKAVEELVRILRPGGSVLIYVWAQEQEKDKQKSKYLKPWKQGQGSGGTAADEISSHLSDGLVFETSSSQDRSDGGFDSMSVNSSGTKDSFRFIHSEETFRNQCDAAELKLENCGFVGDSQTLVSRREENQGVVSHQSQADNRSDCGNSAGVKCDSHELCNSGGGLGAIAAASGKPLQVHVNRTEFKQQDMLVPWKLKKSHQDTMKGSGDPRDDATFHRYYHVFRQGELEALCAEVADCSIKSSYYDQGNWCVVLQKGLQDPTPA